MVEEEKAFPRHGYEIRLKGSIIGQVTSGTVSPTLEKGIGMGYIIAPMAQPGSAIDINIRNREAKAQIVKIPFIKK